MAAEPLWKPSSGQNVSHDFKKKKPTKASICTALSSQVDNISTQVVNTAMTASNQHKEREEKREAKNDTMNNKAMVQNTDSMLWKVEHTLGMTRCQKHPMRHCGLVKQACRPLLLGSIHLCNIVIGGEGAPSGPVATVRIVLGIDIFVCDVTEEGDVISDIDESVFNRENSTGLSTHP
ncbi:hypothetical protein F2P81_001167 [Scophthalmus maximus]|uniref:Uncharacterized protein n=1 Tax=Scophthalmus maximus TaxID=52904 RepID=A0A6A4TWJ7_SCOMX|nr:hypothetical protein F2P81_001167 [Scophthalmus maximus]